MADLRALAMLGKGGLRPKDLAGACGIAKGQIPASVLSMLENSRVPIRIDAVSGNMLAQTLGGGGVRGAAHQFVIVRVDGGPAFLVDPTFAQFLTPGSPNVRQFQRDLAPGFLDTPQGMRLTQDLVNKGYVQLSKENVALYTRALGYDAGPVGGIVPGPVAQHLFDGRPHLSIIQFEASGGTIRQLDLPEPLLSTPLSVADVKRRTAEVRARRQMLESGDRPSSVAEQARHLLDTLPPPTTAQARAARARLERLLKDLESLARRHEGRVPAWDI